MILESVKIKETTQNNKCLCVVEIVLADGGMRFGVRGMRLIDIGRTQPYLAMPSVKKEFSDGVEIFKEVFFPMTSPAREFLEDGIIGQFKAASRNFQR